MKLHLNKNLSTPNTLNKVLSPSKQFDITLRLPVDILNPTILIKGLLTDFTEYNYAYIPGFRRYYFIKNIQSMSTELVTIELTVDVLMSFRDSLKKCYGYVARQENKYNQFFYDTQFPEFAYSKTIIKKFPAKFLDNPNYIIAVRG